MSQENNPIDLFLSWKNQGEWNFSSSFDQILHAKNPMCGDETELFVSQGGNLSLQILGLKGEACSICQASAGILYAKKQLWTEVSARSEWELRQRYLETGIGLEEIPDSEKEFWEIVLRYPGRHRCALLPYVALKKGF